MTQFEYWRLNDKDLQKRADHIINVAKMNGSKMNPSFEDRMITDASVIIKELIESVKTYERDVQEAMGTFLVEMPEPGSDMAKIMTTNRLLKAENDALQKEIDELLNHLEDTKGD